MSKKYYKVISDFANRYVTVPYFVADYELRDILDQHTFHYEEITEIEAYKALFMRFYQIAIDDMNELKATKSNYFNSLIIGQQMYIKQLLEVTELHELERYKDLANLLLDSIDQHTTKFDAYDFMDSDEENRDWRLLYHHIKNIHEKEHWLNWDEEL